MRKIYFSAWLPKTDRLVGGLFAFPLMTKMNSAPNSAQRDHENAYWLQRDLRSDMELDLHRRMTAEEKEAYGDCKAKFKQQDKMYRKLAVKYNVKFVEYPERKDYGM